MGSNYKELDSQMVQAYYNRPEIIKQIVILSQNKEVVASFDGTSYAKRPDIIQYESDVKELIKRGATSFHASEELWDDPLSIQTGMSQKELSSLRKGWDLLLDIDCPYLPYSQIAADMVIQALYANGLKDVTCKFSGNHGFHIGVVFEAFPKEFNSELTKNQFPLLPKIIAEYIMYLIEKPLREKLLESESSHVDSIKVIAQKCGLQKNDIVQNDQLNVYSIVEIDTILLTSRHLYRQAYSLNEKSGLVSLPINPKKVLSFKPEIAKPQSCPISRYGFLQRTNIDSSQSIVLLTNAYDFYSKKESEKEKRNFAKSRSKQAYEEFLEKIPEHCFPPEIRQLLGPLPDGKKRALFILVYFLRSCRYSNDEIIQMMYDWNKKHPEPLRDAYMQGQMSHFLREKRKLLPPNFETGIYSDILRKPVQKESLRYKNPVMYAEVMYKNQSPKKTRIKTFVSCVFAKDDSILVTKNKEGLYTLISQPLKKDDIPKEVLEVYLQKKSLLFRPKFLITYHFTYNNHSYKNFMFQVIVKEFIVVENSEWVLKKEITMENSTPDVLFYVQDFYQIS